MLLLSSAYLAPLSYYACLVRAEQAFVEQWDHYTKQTPRNRCVIASPAGRQVLTIPVVKVEGKQLMRDVRISDHGAWRHLHWNALKTAYNASPFFEYYADDFAPFYEQRYEFLLDFNLALHRLVCELLAIDTPVRLTEAYDAHPVACADLRDFSALPLLREPYYQVFAPGHGFLAGLSIADLLFNLGPEGLLYLMNTPKA